MKLVIVESPAKAKTIEKYLGKDFTVKASVGHVRDLPKSNKNAVDIEHDFTPHYVTVPKKKDVIAELKKLAKKADALFLATDPDREGEAIAWHVLQVLEKEAKGKTVRRVTFNEITKNAVQEAFKHPRDIDLNLLRAQEARRVLDRLVGYDLSGLIWKKVRYGLSAGRVQSPALRILVEREKEINAFISEDFWTITADVAKDKEEFILTCTEEPRDKTLVDTIVKTGEKEEWKVRDIEEKEAKRNPAAPFKTSTLQQAASTRFGFSPSRTMGIAQKLYESGHITYMRTDSTTLAEAALTQAAHIAEQKYGKEYVEIRHYKTKSKTAQEAHEAIRPTDLSKEHAGSNEEQKKLYGLIWSRTIASQMKAANMLRTKVLVQVGDGTIPDFAVSGSRLLFPGWLVSDPYARHEDIEVPKLTVGDILKFIQLHVEEKQTTPPNRYSEAGLVKELEKRGIGRPSTYASIIRTLGERGYVDKEGRSLKPTPTGEVVSDFLSEHFSQYVSDSFTAEMEDELDEIAAGERGYAETLRNFYTPFTKDVEGKKDIKKITDLGPAPKEFPCPLCGSEMIYKLSKTGKFMSCTRFPECTGARTLEGLVIEEEKPIGEHPETGEPIFVLEGPYGPYVQLGIKEKGSKPRRASIPGEREEEEITVEEALKYLSLPRTLGEHPETGNSIVANVGRFGPYIAHNTKPKPDFRSLKDDDVYAISLERALEILKEPKRRRGEKKKS